MSEIFLRPYQRDFIDAVRNEFAKRNKRVVGVAPCGAGKTIMTGWMIRESALKGKRSIFFVHRHELIDQTAQTFFDLQIPFGIIDANHKMNLDKPVQIASVQTLAKRVDNIPQPDFLICDECHHILANTYKKILDAFPNAFLLGVTATPMRTGGVTLCDVFQSMVVSLSVNELIRLRNLTSFRYFAPNIGVDLSKARKKFGEFVEGDIADIMSDKKIIGGIVENYRKLADGKQAICYCVNVSHSQAVADAFNLAGISAAHVDGNSPKNLRKFFIDQFRQGNVKVLCNCELFSEGFDVPKCQAVILARPTMSLTLYIQQAMRAMRPDVDNPDKVAIIIDHVQNYLRHGLPNAERDWTLDPNRKNSLRRYCPICKKIVPVEINPKGEKQCAICHYVFPKADVTEREHNEPDTTEHVGELIEIDTNHETKNPTGETRVKQKPTTIEEFVEIGKKNNRKRGWAVQRALEFANSYKDCLHIAEVVGYERGAAWHLWQQRAAELNFAKKIAKCPSGVLN